MTQTELVDVREYAEGYPVKLSTDEDSGRLVVIARNEGGHNCTAVDVVDLLAAIRRQRPDLLSD